MSSPLLPRPNATPRHNLPAPLTSLVGREADVAEACSLLRQEDMRLLTMTGPGGVGKTRLALKVARELLDDFEGVYFVALAPVRDPNLVIPTIAQTLGVREGSDQRLAETLKAALNDRRLLLLLDNFEQVTAVAPAVTNLLAACPRLKVLVTSRTVLRLYGEYEFAVAPLELPELAERRGAGTETLDPSPWILSHFPSSSAVQLFIQRARAVQRDFTLNDANAPAVAELCVRLDGLPLAIELAAARVKVFEPGAILARLRSRLAPARLKLLSGGPRDLPARQQALRNTIDWSFDLLSPREQALFCRLPVFAGGWTIEAAETVCEDTDVLDGLIALLDMNLIRKAAAEKAAAEDDEPRFTMLESIREYALEKLAARAEEGTVRSKHAHYYLQLAQEAEPAIKLAGQEGWLRRLEIEQYNFRSALHWTQTAAGEVRTHLQLAGALWWFWYLRGYGAEGRQWLEAALALPAGQDEAMERAIVLNGAGLLASEQGDQATARSRLEACLALSQSHGDRRRVAYVLHHLGLVARHQNDSSTAHTFQAESAAIFEELGDHWGSAAALYELGATALAQGDPLASRTHFEQSRELFQKMGDNWGLALALEGLAKVALEQGDLAAARSFLEEGLQRSRALADKRSISAMLLMLGEVRRAQGDPQRAAGLLEESLALYREFGLEPGDGLPRRLRDLGQAVLQGRDYARAAALFEECLAISVESQRADTIGLCLIPKCTWTPPTA
jgi:predicted ATPase